MSGATRVGPTNAVVTRVAANVLEESSVGFIATSGNPLDNRDNTVVGADFLFLNSRLFGDGTLEAEAWYQQSDTEGLEGDDAAFGIGMRLPNATGWRGGFGWRQIERNFFPALGFVNRVDVRDTSSDIGYTHFVGGQRPAICFRRCGRAAGHIADDRRCTDADRGPAAARDRESSDATRCGSCRPSTTSVSYYRSRSIAAARAAVVIPAGSYEFEDYGFDIITGAQRKYAGRLVYRTGDFYDGERTNSGGEFTWKQSRFLTMRLGYDWNRVELPQGNFTTRVMRTTAEVGFSSPRQLDQPVPVRRCFGDLRHS